ncbi:hypothetical protein HF086_003441 [Spodoptera exigua]|uniref:Uncharacterized protein n=1 Tax=Spodoptera exigua TaxID=7107 RepID=A0A922MH58_SPOEX|nr:hypothetical protein HF086_003441 [Spodoptera exigua]
MAVCHKILCIPCARARPVAMTEGRRERGGAAAGASPSPGEVALPAARGPPPRRPIAKFNAKVMRARVRLRAAMQERPAAGSRRAVSASPTTALHTASPFPHSRVPAGHLTNNYSSVKIVTLRPSASLAPHKRGRAIPSRSAYIYRHFRQTVLIRVHMSGVM